MEYYGKSDIGIKRQENQDSFAIKSKDGCTVAVVCDGMGGVNGGKLAANLACECFLDMFFRAFEEFCQMGDSMVASVGISRAVKNAVYAANKTVYERSKESVGYSGMGTTLVAAVFFEDTCYAVNVGDSRIYHLDSEGVLAQITRDHTYIEFLMQNGTEITKQIEDEEKGVITRALGPDERVVPDLYVFDIWEGDTFLLCSDGLYNMVSREFIVNELGAAGENTLETACSRLIAEANVNGGRDNITAVIIKV